MRPDPASSPAKIPIGTTRTPAPEPGLLFPEAGKNGIRSVCPYPAEWLVPDIPDKEFSGTGELAWIHVSLCIDIGNPGAGTASSL